MLQIIGPEMSFTNGGGSSFSNIIIVKIKRNPSSEFRPSFIRVNHDPDRRRVQSSFL